MLWNMILGLIFLGAVRYGDYITYECPQENYSCPKICDVDHIHLPRKECKYAKALQKREERNQGTQEGRERAQKGNEKEGILINGKDKESR